MFRIKIGFIGDLHGDFSCSMRVIDHLVEEGCTELVQAGDFGFVWPQYNQYEQLSRYLKLRKIRMRFLCGNHDQHPALFKLPKDEDRTDQDPEKDNLAPYLVYQHRGSLHQYDDGTRVVFLGGAPSIDYRGRKEHVSWWHEELIRDEDVAAALRWKNTKIDVMATHDAPVRVPGFKETDDMTFVYRARDSHAKICQVIDALKPSLLIHGHWHHRYSGKYNDTQIEGLDHNHAKFSDLYYIYQRSV